MFASNFSGLAELQSLGPERAGAVLKSLGYDGFADAGLSFLDMFGAPGVSATDSGAWQEIEQNRGWNHSAILAKSLQFALGTWHVFVSPETAERIQMDGDDTQEAAFVTGVESFDVPSDWVIAPLDHRISKIMRRPNPYTDQAQFRFQISQHVETHGVCYILVLPNEYGQPSQIYILPKSQISPYGSSSEFPEGSYRTSNLSRFPLNAVIDRNPQTYQEMLNTLSNKEYSAKYIIPVGIPSLVYGDDFLSMTAAMADTLDTDTQMHAARRNSLQNQTSSGPMLVEEPGVDLQMDEKEQLLAEWQYNNASPENAGKAFWKPKGIGVEDPSFSAREMEYSASAQQSRDDILGQRLTPPAMMGLGNIAGYAGVVGVVKAWSRMAGQPLMRLIAGQITIGLQRFFSEENRDFVIVMQAGNIDDPQTKQMELKTDIDAKAMTTGEYRERRNLKPFGDERDDAIVGTLGGQGPGMGGMGGGMPGMPGLQGGDTGPDTPGMGTDPALQEKEDLPSFNSLSRLEFSNTRKGIAETLEAVTEGRLRPGTAKILLTRLGLSGGQADEMLASLEEDDDPQQGAIDVETQKTIDEGDLDNSSFKGFFDTIVENSNEIETAWSSFAKACDAKFDHDNDGLICDGTVDEEVAPEKASLESWVTQRVATGTDSDIQQFFNRFGVTPSSDTSSVPLGLRPLSKLVESRKVNVDGVKEHLNRLFEGDSSYAEYVESEIDRSLHQAPRNASKDAARLSAIIGAADSEMEHILQPLFGENSGGASVRGLRLSDVADEAKNQVLWGIIDEHSNLNPGDIRKSWTLKSCDAKYDHDGDGMICDGTPNEEVAPEKTKKDESGEPVDAFMESDSGGSLMQSLRDNGGFTYQPMTGISPDSGFAVGIEPDRELKVHRDDITPENIFDFMVDNEDLWDDGEIHLGGWDNKKKGPDDKQGDDLVYLDISRVLDSRDEAEELGRSLGQLKIFDLSTHEEIEIMTQEERRDWERRNKETGGGSSGVHKSWTTRRISADAQRADRSRRDARRGRRSGSQAPKQVRRQSRLLTPETGYTGYEVLPSSRSFAKSRGMSGLSGESGGMLKDSCARDGDGDGNVHDGTPQEGPKGARCDSDLPQRKDRIQGTGRKLVEGASEFLLGTKKDRKKILQNIQGNASDEQKQEYTKVLNQALDQMPPRMVDVMSHNVKGVNFYDSVQSVTAEVDAWSGEPRKQGTVTLGFWNPVNGTLNLDGASLASAGGDDPMTHRGLHLHECFHAADKLEGGGYFSESKEWKEAWKSEIGREDAPLSNYATVNESEGAAEFVRYYSEQPEKARELFPKATAAMERVYGKL